MISNEINLPVRSISRSISCAVCDCWDYGNRTNLDKVANRHLIEKPSPKELIIYLCSYLARVSGFNIDKFVLQMRGGNMDRITQLIQNLGSALRIADIIIYIMR